jgi:hypothetical protein
MAAEFSPRLERRFVRDGLPWVVGAGALVLYLVSLNHWVTPLSLGPVVRVNGWDWPPSLSQPLLFLLTCPFRTLPSAWVPLALNGFTALCAALTLVLLARSVALLPHDRLEQQRLLVGNPQALLSLPDAWVPVVLATCALGLQLTFWEHATAASGEMLDLLVVAYCIRCLLEHRVDQGEGWLNQAAVLYGVAMANNWAMVGLLPLFAVALLRTRRLRFFSLRFLQRLEHLEWDAIAPALRLDVRFGLRMALLGLAGLSLFLLVPLVQSFSPDSPLSFWQALQSVAGSYGRNLHLTCRMFLRYHRDVGLLLAAVSLLPVLLLSIRWGAFTTTSSHERFDPGSFILHLAHGFLLLTCLAALFDPAFSPRQISGRTGMALPFLPLYYLAALSIGYYAGVFLLLFGPGALQRISRHYALRRALCWVTPRLVYLLAALALAGLLLKNLPVMRAAAVPHLERYARLIAGSLAPEGAVVLSDDATRLALVQAELAAQGKGRRYIPVATRALPYEKYRSWLRRKYPGRWPQLEVDALPATPGTNAPLNAFGVVQVVSRLAESNRVFCLQASPGLLFERFYLQPQGLVYELKLYPINALLAPPLAPAQVADNQALWRRAIEEEVQPVLRLIGQPELARPEFAQLLMRRAHLSTPPPSHSKVLAFLYSSALNGWGATLQRNGLWAEAEPCFALAEQLNAENLPARLNLLCSSNRLAHQKLTVSRDPPLREQFDKYRDISQLLAENGPFEEPSYCYLLALDFLKAGLFRQSAQQLERVNALAPDELLPRLLLGDLYARARLPDQTLQIVAAIRSHAAFQPLGATNAVELAFLEAEAWYGKTNRAKAEGIIDALLAAHPNDVPLWDRAGAALAANQSYTNALRVVNQQLQATPNRVAALVNQGTLFSLMGDFSHAIPPLTRALSLTNSPEARLSRASVYLRASQLDAAQADYQALLRDFPGAYGAYYLLGEIAWRKADTNAAVASYRQFLASATNATAETSLALARLKSLNQEWP